MKITETNKPKILVTGATGVTGGAAITALREAGQDVRALVHCEDERSERLQAQGAEIVVGDINDFDLVRNALHGVNRAYFVYPIRPGIVQATAQFAQAAQESGVEAIVNMSQISARADAKSHAALQHWLAEQVFNWSGVPVTHLRPTFFAEWFLYFIPMIRQGKVTALFGSGRHAPIAGEDQGRVIAGILQNPESHKGAIYPLYGAVEYTFPELIDLLSREIGRKIEYQQVPVEMMAPYFNARAGKDGQGNYFLQHIGEVAKDHQNGIFSGTNDIVEKITGRKPMTVEAFVDKYRVSFNPEITG